MATSGPSSALSTYFQRELQEMGVAEASVADSRGRFDAFAPAALRYGFGIAAE